MPSPGASALANALGDIAYTVEGGFATTLLKNSNTTQFLSAGIDAGWTSASPATITSMATTIPAQFSGSVSGNGLTFLTAIGIGIDAEVQLWANSWAPVPQIHTYAPASASIVAAIMAASPVSSAGARALANKVADVFVQFFVQEVG